MILDEILAHKRREVEARRRSRPLTSLASSEDHLAVGAPRIASASQDPSVDGTGRPAVRSSRFELALRRPGVSVIAEIKRKSPSGGELRPDARADDLARVYAAAGAAALSVLTDERYFGGSDADLQVARRASGLPVLRKDFVVDAYQIYEAAAIGADAILLIVRAISQAELRELLDLSHRLGLSALVETHSPDEVHQALDAGARIIGVNNRDLDTLVTDVSLAPRLRQLVPPECVFVAESGISEPTQIADLSAAGVDAVLIGEALVRSADPGAKLGSLVAAGTLRSARV